MTPETFVQKWSGATLSERAASHEHFLDLSHLLDQPTPAQSDPTGQDYAFEKPVHPAAAASKGSKGEYGFVDVWKRGHFAWEYKRQGKYKDLTDRYADTARNARFFWLCVSWRIAQSNFVNSLPSI